MSLRWTLLASTLLLLLASGAALAASTERASLQPATTGRGLHVLRPAPPSAPRSRTPGAAPALAFADAETCAPPQSLALSRLPTSQ